MSKNANNSNMIDTVKDNTILYSSYLLKRNKYTTKWQKRWITLRCGQLSYYQDAREVKPIKVINKFNLKSFNVLNNQLLVYTNSRCLQFKTSDRKVLQEWVEALNQFFKNIDNELEYAFMYNTINEVEREEFDDPDDTVALDQVLQPNEATKHQPEVMVEQGTLKKLFRRTNKWKPFECVLTTKNFVMCVNEGPKPYKVVETGDIIDVIEVDPIKNQRWCLLVITKTKTMSFSASDEREFVNWLSALKTVCILNRGV